MWRWTLQTSLAIAMFLFASAFANTPTKIIYVDDDATGVNDGTSWQNAYNFLQNALSDASSSDTAVEIRVAQGTYKPDQGANQTLDDRFAAFHLISKVTVKGGYAGAGSRQPDKRDISAYETILSGDLRDDDPRPGGLQNNSANILRAIDVNDSAILDGLTITRSWGSGMFCQKADPIIINCTFTKNEAQLGGALYIDFNSKPMLINCLFNQNVASGSGGAIFNEMGEHVKLINCRFIDNQAWVYGGGLWDNGYETKLTDCTFKGNLAQRGGALYINRSKQELRNCTFEENKAKRGAGVYNAGANPTLINSTFKSNRATFEGGGMYSYESNAALAGYTFSVNRAEDGGGIYNRDGSVMLTNCMFIDNSAASEGGGMHNIGSSPTLANCTFSGNSTGWRGGGMYNEAGSPILTNCTFDENSAPWGGGMYNYNYGCPILIDCNFTDNSSRDYGGGMDNYYSDATLTYCTFCGNYADLGGGMHNMAGHLILTNCTFSGNAALFAGGMRNLSAIATLTNCTFSGNTSQRDTGAMNNIGGKLTLTNCIVWGNTYTQLVSEITNSYTNFQGGWEGVGNIDADPCFVDPGYWDPNGTPEDVNDDFWVDGDYHLKSQAGRWDPNAQTWVKDDVTSPCIDAGDPMSPIGYEPFPNGGIINMGAYGGTAEASKSYFGEPVCETIIAGDINGDCKIDFADFQIMALHWLEKETTTIDGAR